MTGTSRTKLAEALQMSDEAVGLIGKIFAAGMEKTGVDGEKLFNKFAETGSMKEALGVGDNLVEAVYSKAHQQFSVGKIEQAEQLFRVLSSIAGDKIDHWLGLGICLRARGDHKNAMNAFDAAIKLDPESPVPHFHRLELFIREQEWDSAKNIT